MIGNTAIDHRPDSSEIANVFILPPTLRVILNQLAEIHTIYNNILTYIYDPHEDEETEDTLEALREEYVQLLIAAAYTGSGSQVGEEEKEELIHVLARDLNDLRETERESVLSAILGK
jgi:hypothetical protein